MVQIGTKTDVGNFNKEIRNLKKYPFIRIYHRWSGYGDITIDGNEWDEITADYVVTPNSKIILNYHPYTNSSENYGKTYRTAFKIDNDYNITCMPMLDDNSDDSIIIWGYIN